ncbi:hypothetical protein F2Q68_00013055 [Brassica cretica]|uniref:FKB95-like N-terminal Kelch domain-containing protein n=1 Tax=Brassica cretica TaxID=69181 RepID=A0A8S9HS30_BRACR|nr:hypothetical protein F2Q68_00013055 [Brassica cretica]
MMMSRCDAEEDPSHTKKRKLSPSGLPEEMVLSCLVRVARSEHASFISQNLIYLCLRIPPDPNPRWFTLSLKALDRRLVPVRSYFYQPLEASSMVAHGCGIYVMAAAGVVDGKIYILGGCDHRKSSKWGEVFDPEKQTWDALPMPPPHCRFPSMCESIVINEDKVVALNGAGACVGGYCGVRERDVMEWREVMGLESLRETLAASKLVNYGGRLGDFWESNKPLMLAQGLEITELDEELPGHKLSNSGNNNMLIFWDVLAPPNKLEIWCAEVSLERHKETCEIRGNVLWSQAIMTLDPPPPHRLHCHILNLSAWRKFDTLKEGFDFFKLTTSSKTASTMETESESDLQDYRSCAFDSRSGGEKLKGAFTPSRFTQVEIVETDALKLETGEAPEVMETKAELKKHIQRRI